MRLALFDFDGTLTIHDSFIMFAKHSIGKLGFYKAFIKTLPWIILWKVGLRSNSKAKEHLFSALYKGMDYDCFKNNCIRFEQCIKNDERSDMMAKLQTHKAHGDRVIIVSASIIDWITPWARSHNIEDVLATEVEVDENGQLTGFFKTPNCYGQEKVKRIFEYITDFKKYETWAYGDSSGDNHMLSIVKYPSKV